MAARSQGQVGGRAGRSRAEEAGEPASEPGEGVGLRPVTELKIVPPSPPTRIPEGARDSKHSRSRWIQQTPDRLMGASS